jgi:hypothetical protein
LCRGGQDPGWHVETPVDNCRTGCLDLEDRQPWNVRIWCHLRSRVSNQRRCAMASRCDREFPHERAPAGRSCNIGRETCYPCTRAHQDKAKSSFGSDAFGIQPVLTCTVIIDDGCFCAPSLLPRGCGSANVTPEADFRVLIQRRVAVCIGVCSGSFRSARQPIESTDSASWHILPSARPSFVEREVTLAFSICILTASRPLRACRLCTYADRIAGRSKMRQIDMHFVLSRFACSWPEGS